MTSEFAGALRERISIEHRQHARDVWGGAAGGFIFGGAAWAAIAPLGAGAPVAADSRSSPPRWRVTLRRRTDITLDTRLVWRGKFLTIREVEHDPAEPSWTRMTCEELR